MSDAMENAARAFDQSMGRAPARPSVERSDASGAPEPIFENMGELLDGPAQGGGDDEPALKPEKKVRQPDPDEDEDDEGLDDNVDDEGDEDQDEDEDDDLTDEEKAAKKAAEEDEDPEEAKLMNTEFEVMVDGEPKTVKLKEALDGYIRTETFHQRLNQLAEVKTAITTEAQAVVADRETVQKKLKEAEDILAEIMPPEPDWDAEFAKDGVKANALRKQYDAFKSKVAEIRTKRETTEREASEASLRRTTEFAKAEYPKFVRSAGWKSQEDQIRDTKSMRKTALSVGFSEDEIAAVYDSRVLQVLLKASKYDRMMASRPKAVKKDGKQQVSLGAGRTTQSRTAPRGIQAAQSRLSKTGSIDDATDVFSQILSQSRKRNR